MLWRLRLYLTELLADFCRWRARAAERRIARATASCRGWLELEKIVIEYGGGDPPSRDLLFPDVSNPPFNAE